MDIDDSSSDEDSLPPVAHIVTDDEILERGLILARYQDTQIDRCSTETNITRFRNHFGPSPRVAATIYEDMQRTNIDEARIEGSPETLVVFLKACYFLRKYPKESQQESILSESI